MDRIREHGQRLSGQFTPRAQLGIGLLIIMLAAAGISTLSDHVATQRLEAEQLQRELQTYRALAAESDWAQRATEISQSLRRAQAGFWRGRTTGIISAQLQGEVTRLATGSGLGRIDVEVRPDPLPLGDEAFYFEIRVTGEDRNGQFLALFDNFATHEHLLVPNGLDWERANGTVRIGLVAPAMLEAGGETQP
jgi:hypothetical protein